MFNNGSFRKNTANRNLIHITREIFKSRREAVLEEHSDPVHYNRDLKYEVSWFKKASYPILIVIGLCLVATVIYAML
jgi:hypothetical protein